MNQNNEILEEGISLGELFSIIWKRKIIISIITFSVIVISLLSVMLIINPSKSFYQSTFEIDFLGFNNGKYPSGAIFDYRDIISDESILTVTENNDYKKIDIEDFTNDTITITMSSTNTYVINVSCSIFSSKSEAVAFMQALLDLERSRFVADYEYVQSYNNIYLEASNNANSFDSQLMFLEKQQAYLTESFNNLINLYGASYVGDNYLTVWAQEYSAFLALNDLQSLQNKVQYNDFVKNYDENLSSLIVSSNILKSDIESLVSIIEELKLQRQELIDFGVANNGYFPDIESYNSKIIELTLEKHELEDEKDVIDAKISNGDYNNFTTEQQAEYDEFKKELEELIETTTTYTNLVSEFSAELFDRFLVTKINDREVVEVIGSISLLFTLVLGGMLGGGTSCVAFIALDLSKKNKENLNPNN